MFGARCVSSLDADGWLHCELGELIEVCLVPGVWAVWTLTAGYTVS